MALQQQQHKRVWSLSQNNKEVIVNLIGCNMVAGKGWIIEDILDDSFEALA